MNVKNVNVGDYLSEIQYYKVIDKKVINNKEIYTIENERGLKIDTTLEIIQDGMFSSNSYSKEEKVSLTEMETIFKNIGDSIFTVIYNKQIKPEEVLSKLEQYAKNGIDITTLSKNDIKSLLDGEERTLIGYRLGNANFGRSNVIDITIQKDTSKNYDNRLRLVDHRTIKSLTVKDTKYSLK